MDKNDDNIIRIPRNSYTAFRLKYCDASELYHTSTVTFIGTIPNAWILDKKSIVLAKFNRINNDRNNTDLSHTALPNFENAVHRENDDSDDQIKASTSTDSSFRHGKRLFSRLLGQKKPSTNADRKLDNSSISKNGNINLLSDGPSNTALRQKGYESGDDTKESNSRSTTNTFVVNKLSQILVEGYQSSDSDTSIDASEDDESSIMSNFKTDRIRRQNHADQSSDLIPPPHPLDEGVADGERKDSDISSDATVKNGISSNMQDFYKKPTDEKHKLLEEEINRVMQSLEKSSYRSRTHFKDEESASEESDAASFVTASEDTANPEQGAIKFQYPRPSKSVTFQTPNVDFFKTKKDSNHEDIFLKKQRPAPYAETMPNERKHCGSQNAEELSGEVKESFTEINEDEAEAYANYKSETLTAKIAPNQHIKHFKQKKITKRLLKLFQAGEIVKMEKLLVMVSNTEKVKMSTHSTRNIKVRERWKEYLTVIRVTDDTDYPAIIQFYKSATDLSKEVLTKMDENAGIKDINKLKIPTASILGLQKEDHAKSTSLEKDQVHSKDSSKCCFSLALSKRYFSVSFANLLDKSIRITKDTKVAVTHYTLLARSSSSAIIWLSILRKILDPDFTEKAQGTLLIAAPSLDISFTILGAFKLYKTLTNEENINSSFIDLKFTEYGYIIPRTESFLKLLDLIEKQVVQLKHSGKLPSDAAANRFIQKLKNDRSFLGLTFRKYDRLEWMFGENESIVEVLWNILGSSYELELREFEHESHALKDNSLEEPFPIEGFAVKLSNRKGNLTSLMGKNYFKLIYAFTVKNLLFFQDYYNAVPLFPSSGLSARNFISPTGDVLDMDQLDVHHTFQNITFRASSYEKSGSHVKWLQPGMTAEQFQNHDLDALFETERRSYMVSNTYSAVDLCKVKDIRLVGKKDISSFVQLANRTVWRNLYKDVNNDEHDQDEFADNCLELVMEDNSILRLQLANRALRDEWAKNLVNLSEYWTLKKKEDLMRLVVLRDKNLSLMNSVDDNYESLIASESENNCYKWETSKAYTDPQLYSISSYVLDKPVLMEGYIYCKKFRSKQFKLFYAVLSPGFFTIYEIFKRSKRTGVAKNSAYYRRYATISLTNCYVFGSTGKSDEKQKDKSFFNVSSFSNGLPRVYGDGWRSSESPYERSFTIWFGSKREMLQTLNMSKIISNNNLDRGAVIDKESDGKLRFDSESENESTDSDGYDEVKKSEGKRGLKKIISNSFERHKKSSSQLYDRSTELESDADSDSDAAYSDTGFDEFDSEVGPRHGEKEQHDAVNSHYFNNAAKDLPDFEQGGISASIQLLASISKLGLRGRAMAFLAKSRLERDLWVTRLLNEIQRSSGAENS